MRVAVLALLLCACGSKQADDGRSAAQRATAGKTDRAAKKGALTPKQDVTEDLAKQRRNLGRLRANERGAREAGSRIAAWAAARDARAVEKRIAEDERKIEGAK